MRSPAAVAGRGELRRDEQRRRRAAVASAAASAIMARLAATSPVFATIWKAAMRISSPCDAQAPSSRGRSPKRAISPKTSAAKATNTTVTAAMVGV